MAPVNGRIRGPVVLTSEGKGLYAEENAELLNKLHQERIDFFNWDKQHPIEQIEHMPLKQYSETHFVKIWEHNEKCDKMKEKIDRLTSIIKNILEISTNTPELNMSNYNEDDVSILNEGMIQVSCALHNQLETITVNKSEIEDVDDYSTVCPKCKGQADNGFTRTFPPMPYHCSKCSTFICFICNLEKTQYEEVYTTYKNISGPCCISCANKIKEEK